MVISVAPTHIDNVHRLFNTVLCGGHKVSRIEKHETVYGVAIACFLVDKHGKPSRTIVCKIPNCENKISIIVDELNEILSKE